jgi:hypothetical protein
MPSKNERVELEMKIMKYRALARDAPDKLSTKRIETLIAELNISSARSTSKVTLGCALFRSHPSSSIKGLRHPLPGSGPTPG